MIETTQNTTKQGEKPMHIPEYILWAMGDDGCSAVKIFCEENLREKIATGFKEEFNKEYETIINIVEEIDGTCYEKEEGYNPLKDVQITNYGILITFYCLALYCGDYGDFLACRDAEDALEKALETIRKKYPSITYDGFIAYCWSDVHSGEACQYEISSETGSEEKDDKTLYDFIGEALEDAFIDEDFLERVLEDLEWGSEEEFKSVIKFFYSYQKWIPSDCIKQIIEFSKGNEDNITESLKAFVKTLQNEKETEK